MADLLRQNAERKIFFVLLFCVVLVEFHCGVEYLSWVLLIVIGFCVHKANRCDVYSSTRVGNLIREVKSTSIIGKEAKENKNWRRNRFMMSSTRRQWREWDWMAKAQRVFRGIFGRILRWDFFPNKIMQRTLSAAFEIVSILIDFHRAHESEKLSRNLIKNMLLQIVSTAHTRTLNVAEFRYARYFLCY